MEKFYIEGVANTEYTLRCEFGLAPVDVHADVCDEIERIVECVEAGEREIDSPYLNITIIID